MDLSDSGSTQIAPGTSFAQYRIVRKLGGGGMGEVYLAVDTQLERRVALKFLNEKTRGDNIARKRLLAEARAAASVDHPYICKVYEAGDVAGNLFISMEYVEGETLAERISNSGPQPVKELLRISCEIVEALEKAHHRGLIHRDLKPSNILLTTEGHVKVTDFGLAMYLPRFDSQTATIIDDSHMTEPGGLFGTPAYMSPEQARGQMVDGRSDLFSFGIILYELLTGRHPFKKNTAAATMAAVLLDPPFQTNRKDCPASLQTIIDRLLAKEPNARYQSAQQTLLDLKDVLEGKSPLPSAPAPFPISDNSISRPVDANSLAVLPFSNLTADRENEFFSDGITEELIARIGMIKKLKVISRTSVMRYKGTNLDIPSIGQELRVANILEGSVQRLGSRFRIIARLVEAEKGHQVWSEIYDRDLSDIFAVQADVCRQISEALCTTVSTTEAQRLGGRHTVNPEAYTCYLKARHFLNKLTPENIKKGIEYFHKALNLDSAFADAYAGLAKCYAYSGHFSYLPIDDAYPRARAAAKQALELDRNMAEANTAMALVAMLYDWDWVMAESGFKRGLRLNPNDGEAHVFYSWYLQAMGRTEKAVAEARSAVNVDPLSPITNTNLGHMLTIGARYDEAIDHLRKTLEMDPVAVHPKYLIAAALAVQGNFDVAVRMLQDETMPTHSKPLLAWVYALNGKVHEASQLLDKITNSSPITSPSSAIAMAYLLIGDEQNGAIWLERAYAERDSQLMHVRSNPLLARVRSHPKLLQIYDRMGLLN